MAVDRVRPDKVRGPRKVLFDSSFLIAAMERPTPWQHDIVGYLGRIDGVVLQPVRAELERLAGAGGRQSSYARLALELIDRGALRFEASGRGRADDELVSQALRDGAAVATIDGNLIRQLRASHVEVVSLRSGRVALV